MSSNIDPTKPGFGLAYTADLRQNLLTAKLEIEELQDGKSDVGHIHDGLPSQITILNISSGGTSDLDTLPIAEFRSCKWIVTAIDRTSNLVRSSEILAVHNGSEVYFTIYGKIGDTVIYSIEVEIVSSDMVLSVVNNHSNTLDFSIVRIPTKTI